nr:DUF1015 domain-containing protein [Actinomadura atramentaria]
MNGDLPSGSSPEEFSARAFGAPDPRAAAGLVLAPFRGVRFDPRRVGGLAAVTSPPYDLIDDQAVRALLDGDGHNVARLIRSRAAGADHAEAAATLRRWLADGSLAPDDRPALYVYEAAEGARVLQRGLIGALGLRAEGDGVVLPHENVYPGPVRDRLALMTATRANLEPILLTYEGGAATAAIVDRAADADPLVAFLDRDGLTHRLWSITDPRLHAEIARDLLPRRALIADGHHRYATYRLLQARQDGPGPCDYGMALLVDSTRYPPRLSAIHRVVPGLPPERAAAAARTAFTVAPQPDPDTGLAALAAARGPAFLLGGPDDLHLLTDPDPARLARVLPPDASPLLRSLNTTVLDRLLIADVWDLPASAVEIVHDDPRAALDLARATGGTAVLLNPLSVEDVTALAARGERVPRKSTSFGPKPRSGLVLRLLDLPDHDDPADDPAGNPSGNCG